MSSEALRDTPGVPVVTARPKSQIRTIVEKEILENLYSFRFYLIIILLTALMIGSLIVMYRDYNVRLALYETQRASLTPNIATLPPSQLSILVKGLDDTLSATYDVSMVNGGIQRNSTQQKTNTLFSIISTPDLLYIIRIILSLAALLITFDAICGEKEKGTLRLILSNQIDRNRMLVGKWIGSFISLAVPFLLISLIMIVIFMALPRVSFSRQELWRITGDIGLSLLYVSIFISLGLWISATVHNSSASMAASLLIWTFLVFLIPQLSPVIAEQFVHVPPAESVDEQIALERIHNIHLATQDVSRLSADQDKERTQVYIKREGNSANTIFRIEEEYLARLNRLVNLTKNIARLSPAACLSFAVSDVSGTGLSELERARTNLLAFKRDYANTIFENRVLPRGSRKTLPQFNYQRLSGATGVQAAGVDLILLIIYSAICFVGAQLALYRYDIR